MSFYDDIVNETVDAEFRKKVEYEKKQKYDYDIEKHKLECLKHQIYNWLMLTIKEKTQEQAKKGEYSMELTINPVEHIKYTFGIDYSLSDIMQEYINPIWEQLKKQGFECSCSKLDSSRITFRVRWRKPKDYYFRMSLPPLPKHFLYRQIQPYNMNQHANTKEIEND